MPSACWTRSVLPTRPASGRTNSPADNASASPSPMRTQHHVTHHALPGNEKVLLRHPGETARQRRAVAGIESEMMVVRQSQAGDHAQQRTFAAAAATEQASPAACVEPGLKPVKQRAIAERQRGLADDESGWWHDNSHRGRAKSCENCWHFLRRY